MSDRAVYYAMLTSKSFALPPLRDRSLTLPVLKGIYKEELMATKVNFMEGADFKVNASRKSLAQAIEQECVDAPKPLWFSGGRLPSKPYLVDFLYSLDNYHPLLGLPAKFSKRRRFYFDEDCKRCDRQVAKKRRIEKAQPNRSMFERGRLLPTGMRATHNSQMLACELFKSRHNCIKVRRAINDSAFNDYDIHDIARQLQIRREIEAIDNLIDQFNQ